MRNMKLHCTNFGPIKSADLEIKPLTLIGGKNQSGKTYLTKIIYSLLSPYTIPFRNSEKDPMDLIQQKIRWVFQQDRIGNLVNKYLPEKKSSIKLDNIKATIEQTNVRKFNLSTNQFHSPYNKVHYLSTPMILDIDKAITNYRSFYSNNYGVSDIFWDYLQTIQTLGKADKSELSSILNKIQKIVGGKFKYDSKSGTSFIKKEKEIPISLAASGIKLFGILYLLTERGQIDDKTLLIIEEPENHLHPSLTLKFIELLLEFIDTKVDFIITTHSPIFIRYIEHIINSKKIKNEKISILHLTSDSDKLEDMTGKSSSDIHQLLKILESLTESYFDITMMDAELDSKNGS